jgi:predicted nucleic acid-binding protein
MTISLDSFRILGGLKYRDACRQLDAEIYKNLRTRGCLIDDTDILIAGIAQANGLILATRNQAHFERIESLQVENWSLPKTGR